MLVITGTLVVRFLHTIAHKSKRFQGAGSQVLFTVRTMASARLCTAYFMTADLFQQARLFYSA